MALRRSVNDTSDSWSGTKETRHGKRRKATVHAERPKHKSFLFSFV